MHFEFNLTEAEEAGLKVKELKEKTKMNFNSFLIQFNNKIIVSPNIVGLFLYQKENKDKLNKEQHKELNEIITQKLKDLDKFKGLSINE